MLNLSKIALVSGLVVSGIAVSGVFAPAKAAGINLAGNWLGTGYTGFDSSGNTVIVTPPELIGITINSNNLLVATKITGDTAVPAGNITFQGTVPSIVNVGTSFPVTFTTGAFNNPASGTASATLTVLTANSFTGSSVTFARTTSVPEPLNILGATAGLVLFGTVSTALKRRKVSK